MIALIERLVAASVDLALFAALVALGIRLLRPRSARLQALLWLLVMIKPLVGLVAAPAVPLAAPAGVAALATIPVQPEIEVFRRAGGEVVYEARSSESWRLLVGGAGLWLALWLTGIAALLLFAAWDRMRLRRIVRAASEPPAALRERFAGAVRWLGARRAPDLRVTPDLESPALAGVIRPVVLVPAWLAEDGSPEQVDWALRHELMHWRVGDHLAGAVRDLFRTVFFFHPVAWWVGRRWEEAAELACDRALVSSEAEAACYAERLFEMLVEARGRRRPGIAHGIVHGLASGLFATRTQIGRRIAALLREPLSASAHLGARGAFAVALIGLASLFVGTGCRPAGGVVASLELTGPEGRVALEAQGDVEWSREFNDVDRLGSGSRVRVEQERDGVRRRAEFLPAADGGVERRYWVDGAARPFGREARVWLATALPRFSDYFEGTSPVRWASRPWRRWRSHVRNLI